MGHVRRDGVKNPKVYDAPSRLAVSSPAKGNKHAHALRTMIVEINQAIEFLVLSAVADDYEDLDTLHADVARAEDVSGVKLSRSDVFHAPRSLVDKELVAPYLYDIGRQAFVPSDTCEESAYFLASDKGQGLIKMARG